MAEQVYGRRWWILVALALSMIVVGLDNLILNVALPTIQRDLNASTSHLQWSVDAYTFVFAALLLGTGSLGDRFGRKLLLNAGLLIFGLGSLGAAMFGSADALIAWRVVMGVGGALLMPATFAILINAFPPAERGWAIAMWAATAAVAILLGPTVGGLLLEPFSWSSVFYVNPPIVLVALVAGYFLVPESKDPAGTHSDVVGMALSVAGLGTVVYSLIEAPSNGWGDWRTIGGLVLGGLVLAGMAAWELRSPHPMLPMHYFRNMRFSMAALAVAIEGFSLFGSLYMLAQFLQYVHGYSAPQAGLRLLPMAVMIISAPTANVLAGRFGTKAVVALGLTIIALDLVGLAGLAVDTGDGLILLMFAFFGLGMGFTVAPCADALLRSLPQARAGIGSGTQAASMQVGGTMGVAVLGSMLNSSYTDHVKAAAAHLSAALQSAAEGSVGAAVGIAARLGHPVFRWPPPRARPTFQPCAAACSPRLVWGWQARSACYCGCRLALPPAWQVQNWAGVVSQCRKGRAARRSAPEARIGPIALGGYMVRETRTPSLTMEQQSSSARCSDSSSRARSYG